MKNKFLKIFIFVFIFTAFGQAILALGNRKPAYNELRLEGILYEALSPSDSVAIINGTLLKEGEKFQDYKVVKISPAAVSVVDLIDQKQYPLYLEEKALSEMDQKNLEGKLFAKFFQVSHNAS